MSLYERILSKNEEVDHIIDEECEASKEHDTDVVIKHRLIRAIENGKFLYDPKLVEAAVTIGNRLANIDHYYTIDYRALRQHGDEKHSRKTAVDTAKRGRELYRSGAEALMGDLEDFMRIVSKFMDRIEYLHEYHAEIYDEVMFRSDNPVEAYKGQTNSFASFFKPVATTCQSMGRLLGITFCQTRWMKGKGMPRRITLPHEFEKRQRQDMYGGIIDALLESANMITDILFLVTQLVPLISTFWSFLFWISVAALAATFLGRLVIGASMFRQVDWKDPKRIRKYFFGVILALVEPISGFTVFVKQSFRDQESLRQKIIGESVGSFIKDSISTQAKVDFMAARMSILTAAVMLLKDLPQLAVEIVYLTSFQHGTIGIIFSITLITSLLAVTRQLVEAYYLLNDIPILRNLLLARHIVGDSDVDIYLQRIEDGDDLHERDDSTTFKKHPSSEDKVFRSVKRALAEFFQWDPEHDVSQCSSIPLYVASWMMKILVCPLTFGISLFWASADWASYRAYKHFRKSLKETLVLEGDPFPLVDVESEIAKKSVLCPVQLPCTTLLCCTGRAGVRRVQNGMNFNEYWLPFVFSRMDPVRMFQCVRTLDLTHCVSVNDDLLRLVAIKCQSLQNLNLSFCTKVSDTGLQAFHERGSIALTSLTLDSCLDVSDSGIAHIAQGSHKYLRELRLRNLPNLTNDTLISIANHCTGLHELALVIDPHCDANSEFYGHSLVELMKRCGSSLRALHLDNVNVHMKTDEYPNFINCISRSMRYLSLVSFSGNLTDENIRNLTKKTPFLRELRLNHSGNFANVASSIRLNCPSLRELDLRGSRIPWSDGDLLWNGLQDIQFLYLDHPSELFLFAVNKILIKQIETYQTSLRLVVGKRKPEKSQKIALKSTEERKPSIAAAPNSGNVEVFEEETRVEIFQNHASFEGLQEHAFSDDNKESFKERIDHIIHRISELSPDLLQKYNGKLQYDEPGSDNPHSAKVLALVSDLADFVRRALHRETAMPRKQFLKWLELVGEREASYGNSLVDRLEGAIFNDSLDPQVEPPQWPYLNLNTFGVMSTPRLDIKIDFANNQYTFICPRKFVGYYSLGKKLTGRISPLGGVNLHKERGVNRRGLQRHWFIPADAHFYCWAYPVHNLDMTELHFLENQNDKSTIRRLLHYGGFLYFGADRQFISASALTVGSALSYNGPYELPEQTVHSLKDRWQKVTIEKLQLEGEETEFCYIFHGEKILPPSFNEKLNPFGGFAYKSSNQKKSYFYALAGVLEAFPDLEESFLVSPIDE